MKNYLILSVLIFSLLTLSCGGGGGSSSNGGSSSEVAIRNDGIPSISVSLNSNEVKRGETTYGKITWYDSDADINQLVMENWYGPSMTRKSTSASSIGIRGVSGSADFRISSGGSSSIGMHTGKFYVIDDKGNRSNVISHSVHISAMGAMKEKEEGTPWVHSIGK